jgi:hypothetical protein
MVSSVQSRVALKRGEEENEKIWDRVQSDSGEQSQKKKGKKDKGE